MNTAKHSRTTPRLPLFAAATLSLFALFGLQACGGGGGGGGTTPTVPTLSITAASVIEGNMGSTNTADFAVTLSTAASSDVTVTYSTSDNTATTADSDYVVSAGDTLVIPAGDTSATILITVTGDDTLEFDETFNLQISNAQNATITNSTQTVTGTILSDDSLAGYYTSSGATTLNEGAGSLVVPIGNFQVIADINRLSIIDLTNNLIYIADISAFDTATSFTANARIYKAGNYTNDNASISGVINVDQSLDLTLTADSGNAGGDGNYTATDGVMSLGYSAKNGDAPIDITSEFTWSSSTGGIQPITNTSINISTNNDVNSVNFESCDINSVTLENVISEQTGRIRSFSISPSISCITNTPLNGYITNFDTTSPDDTMLFILFSENDIHAAILQ